MLVSMAIFLVICGSAFTLLGVSQQRYATESQVVNSFQEARLGLDQIVRDVNDSGYPPPNQFEFTPQPQSVAVSPVAWSPGYPALSTQCTIGVTCVTPWIDGMFIETNPTPQVPNSTVQYIRYHLIGNTLYRGVFPKNGADPYSSINDNQLVPFVQNVMNEASAAQIAQINLAYPNMFPGGTPVPLFTYLCDSPSGPQNCTAPGVSGVPTNIRSVLITLIVATPSPDPQTGKMRVLELTGQGSRINSFP
jgi:type II secretory pathway pseudopilin PulG